MAQKLLMIAAGGTGGHMFPAQALAEAMLKRGWRVKLSTDARGARYTGGFPHSTEITQVQSATFARGGVLAKALVGPKILAGVLAAAWSMQRDRPDAVVGFGGYPSIPALGAATLLGLPRMIHEQNGVLGRVNRLFSRRVAQVACGVWPTELPEGAQGVPVGNPVRAAVLARAGAGYITPGDYPMSILVIGGSQGARILSDVVPGAIAALPPGMLRNIRVSHQARGRGWLARGGLLCRTGDRCRCAAVLQRRAGADVRGATGHLPRRGLDHRRSHGDRAALDPDPLCRRRRRPPDRQCTRAGRGGCGDPDPGKAA